MADTDNANNADLSPAGDDAGSGTTTNWYEGRETITGNPEVLAFAKKYKSEDEAIIGGQKAEAKIGSSFRLPPDAKSLTTEQKGQVLGFIRQLRDVPDKPEGYEIAVPEGLPRNEQLESAFKAFAFERGWDKKDVGDLMALYHGAITTANAQKRETDVKNASKSEQELRLRWGADYQPKMDGIGRTLRHFADELGFTYENDKKEICSKLNDCLDETGLGNKVPVLMMLDHIYQKYIAEGEPILPSGGGVGGKGRDFFDYDKRDENKG